MSTRILVGVSGGIDSAAVVMMLRERGFDVVAMWIDMLGLESQREDVVRLCEKLQVELVVKDARADFKRIVVDRVLLEHRLGRTPSPCTICNPLIKWQMLWQQVALLGCEYIATGHYISIVERCARRYLECGVDPVKDQSYYLWAMGVEQTILEKTLTPLGEFHKSEVREYVKERGYEELCAKRESQSLCFVQGGYGEFLTSNLNPKQGVLLDSEGRDVGTHSGAVLYTIGQKRGFNYLGEGKVEVRSIDPQCNVVRVGEPLMTDSLVINEGWFNPVGNEVVRAKIRGIGVNVEGGVTVSKLPNEGEYRINTTNAEKFWAPAVGQPVVLFQGTIVVGGGVLHNI